MRGCAARLVAILLLAASGGCEALGRLGAPPPTPLADVAGVRLRRLTPAALEVDFLVEVTNPYGVALPLVHVRYDLAREGRTLVAGSAPITRDVAAGELTTVPLLVVVPLADLLAASDRVRPGDEIDYDLSGDLTVDAPGVGRRVLPFRRSGTLPVPAPIEVEARGLTWPELDYRHARGRLELALRNPNSFAVSVRRIRCDVTLAGAPVAHLTLSIVQRLIPGDVAVISFPFEIDPARLGPSVFRAFEGSSVAYELRGEVDVGTQWGDLTLDFDRGGSVPQRQAEVRR